jgi:cysteine desulfurase / selenocysteine lyase
MASQWDEVRRDFPAIRNQTYLNAAAASPTPWVVRKAVDEFYRDLEDRGDLDWERWMNAREVVRAKVARLIGAEPDEIAFTPNTSTGINLIADLIGEDGPVLSDELEFPTVTLPWIHRGIAVHFMPAVEGVLRLESFAAKQAPRAATIAISHVQFSNGCRQDLDAFGALKGARRLVVCASQSIGAFPIDVRRSGVDALATAGHKWLCAGYGAGFLYVSREILAKRPPRTIGWLSGEDPYAFDPQHCRILPTNARTEMGCPPFGAVFALGAAVDYVLRLGQDAIAERVLALNMYLTFRLEKEGFPVLSPAGEHRSGQTLVAVDEPKRARDFLQQRRIVVTEKPEGIRIATHFYNNERDIDTCVEALVAFRSTLGRGERADG